MPAFLVLLGSYLQSSFGTGPGTTVKFDEKSGIEVSWCYLLLNVQRPLQLH